MEYFSHAWLPWIYQYGLGGVLFIIGIALTLRAGSFSPKTNPKHRKWMTILLLGYFWYLLLHGAWILAALGHEVLAGIGAAAVVVLAVFTTWVTFHRERRAA